MYGYVMICISEQINTFILTEIANTTTTQVGLDQGHPKNP